MSEEQLIEVISRAVVEAEFRTLLINEPEKALEGFDLSAEEIELLKNIELATIESVSNELEERVSRAGLPLSGGLAEMNELEMMNIQQAMNRESQAFQMISSVMKSQHDLLEAIIRNMRS
jgi:hypothetical protein